MVKKLKTVGEVISHLGGNAAVRDLTNRNSNPSTVLMWKHRERFPPNTYAIMNAALRAKNADAPASLWDMAEAL